MGGGGVLWMRVGEGWGLSLGGIGLRADAVNSPALSLKQSSPPPSSYGHNCFFTQFSLLRPHQRSFSLRKLHFLQNTSNGWCDR